MNPISTLEKGEFIYEIFKDFYVLLFSSLITVYYIFISGKRKSPPKGPIGLPLVGYLPFLDPKAPYETLSSLVDKYGPVYSIRLGSVLGIVVADPILLRKVLSMEETTGRAPLYLTHGIMKGYGLICAQGNMWKEHRKFVLGFMRHNGMKTSLGRNELQEWISGIANEFNKKLSSSPELEIDPSSLLLHYIGNTMNYLIFGTNYSADDENWICQRNNLAECAKLLGVAGPINFLPLLRFLPRYRKVIQLIKASKKISYEEYERNLQKYATSFGSKGKVEKDSKQAASTNSKSLMEAYVKENYRRQGEIGTFHKDQILHVAGDMFGAGTETTVTTIRWHLLDLASHPKVQGKMRLELQQLGAVRNNVTMDCLSKATYCQAAVMETQRLRSIVPTGIPHGVTKEFTIEGFTFPEGSMILPLQWRIHRDPKFWHNPLKFDPTRFLDSSNNIVKSSSFIPFQTGKRVCIGDEFAKIVIMTFVAQIILNFKIQLPEYEKLDVLTGEPICGLTLVPKPHKLLFIPDHSS